MSNMPELGDASEDGTRKSAQSVEEDTIDADTPQKAQGVHAKQSGANCHSC